MLTTSETGTEDVALAFHVVTLLPEFYDGLTREGVFARAVSKGLVDFVTHDLRDYSERSDRRVDDRPFGGGAGMVIRADVTASAVAAVKQPKSKVIFVTPTGRVFDNSLARSLSAEQHIVFVAGRYEGFDERVVELEADLQVSLGDFVLSGGDPAVLAMVDAIARFVPGVLGNPDSAQGESFEDGLLEEPVYTRPEVFGGVAVPPVLLSGDHSRIAAFRRRERLRRTASRRPDLLLAVWDMLTRSEQSFVNKIWKSFGPS